MQFEDKGGQRLRLKFADRTYAERIATIREGMANMARSVHAPGHAPGGNGHNADSSDEHGGVG